MKTRRGKQKEKRRLNRIHRDKDEEQLRKLKEKENKKHCSCMSFLLESNYGNFHRQPESAAWVSS